MTTSIRFRIQFWENVPLGIKLISMSVCVASDAVMTTSIRFRIFMVQFSHLEYYITGDEKMQDVFRFFFGIFYHFRIDFHLLG